MRARVSLWKYIVYCILESSLVYLLILAFMVYMNLSMDKWLVAVITVGSNIIFHILVSYPISAVCAGILIPVSSLVLYLYKKVIFVKYAKQVWEAAYGSIKWFWNYCISDTVKVDVFYSHIILVCCIILCSILIYLLATKWCKSLLTMVFGAAVLSFMWLYGYDEAFKYIQYYLFISFLLFSFTQYDLKETAWKLKREKYTSRTAAAWITCTFLSTLAIFFIINFLPLEIKPVNVTWLDDHVFNKFQDFGFTDNGFFSGNNSRIFSISTFGYQEKPSKLGGSVKASDKLLLNVKIEGNVDPPFYLRGTVKDTYTGSYWTNSDLNLKSISPQNKLGDLSGDVSRINEYKNVLVTVYPQAINTVSIFNLWKPDMVDINSSAYNYNSDGELLVPGNRMKAKVYKVYSEVPVVYSDDMSKAGNAEIDESFQKYLALPESLPDRVKSLTMNITGRYNTDYEKAEAIQDYLRSNFSYTLNTSSVPEDRDFVDYFLFDEKKGYCTYYASAMAVMSRAAKIPSRYVEGFILEGRDKSGDGFYKATAAKAHAWVELYFNGYGWVRFEPTANYQSPDYKRPAETATEPTPETPDNNLEDLKNQQDIRRNRAEEQPGDVSKGAVSRKIPVYVYVIIAAAFALLIRMLSKLYSLERTVKRADENDGREAAIEYYCLLEKKLKRCGLERSSGETPLEFGTRVDEKASPFEMNMSKVMRIFNSTRFGNARMELSDRKAFKEVLQTADKYTKYRKGIVKYLAYKYIL